MFNTFEILSSLKFDEKIQGDITNHRIDENYNMDFLNKLLAQENQQKKLVNK
jgi:hypothetical protein